MSETIRTSVFYLVLILVILSVWYVLGFRLSKSETDKAVAALCQRSSTTCGHFESRRTPFGWHVEQITE